MEAINSQVMDIYNMFRTNLSAHSNLTEQEKSKLNNWSGLNRD